MREVDVRWWPSDRDADAALTTHARAARGAGPVEVGRLCPVCGSAGHGRPWLRYDGTQVHVSLARSGPHLVTVLAGTPVGVDVESVAAVERDWRPELVLAPGEEPGSGSTDAAALWVAKEAVLKYLGTGLATPMTEVQLAAYEILAIEAPEGYLAAVCTGRAGSGSS